MMAKARSAHDTVKVERLLVVSLFDSRLGAGRFYLWISTWLYSSGTAISPTGQLHRSRHSGLSPGLISPYIRCPVFPSRAQR